MNAYGVHPPAARMDREAKALLSHCTALLDTYNAGFEDIEEHAANYLDQKQITNLKLASLMLDIVKGCVHYKPIINIVLQPYFETSGQHVRHHEVNSYVVLTYVYLFELDNLTLAYFKKLANTFTAFNMYKFLTFALESQAITSWMADAWYQIYEEKFVDQHILKPLLRFLPELHRYVSDLQEKVNTKTVPKKKECQNTVLQPFNLTQPRPRKLPVPAMIPKVKNANPVPESIYKVPVEVKKLEDKKKQNELMAKKKLWEADNFQLECANAAMTSKTLEKLKKIEEEKQSQLQFNKKKALPLPSFQKPTPIKMTKAAILREGQLHLKKEEEEMSKWEDLENGMRDMSPFVNWQTAMKNRDQLEQQKEEESLRLKAKISHEDAILSKHKLTENKRQLVRQIKQKAEKAMQILLQQQIEEDEQSKKIVQTISQGHKKAKEAKKKIQEYKKKVVEEMQIENRQLMAEALEQAEVDMKKRLEVINEIRAMAAMAQNRPQKLIDLTQTSNSGLLCEMSLVELKERLTLLKTEKQEQLNKKRDEIIALKQAQQDLVLDNLEMIFKHRNEQSTVCKNQSKEKKPLKAVITDQRVLALQQELAEKKSKRQEQEILHSIKAGLKKLTDDNVAMFTKMQSENFRYKQVEISKEKDSRKIF